MKIIKDELSAIRTEFTTPRRTEIVENEGEVEDEDLIAREDMVITVSHAGYVKRVPLSAYRAQRRGGKGRYDIKTEGRNGLVVSVRAVTAADQLMLLSKEGMVVRIPATAISQIGRNTMGVRIMRLGEGDSLMGVALVAEVDETTPPSDIPSTDAPPETLPENPPAAE